MLAYRLCLSARIIRAESKNTLIFKVLKSNFYLEISMKCGTSVLSQAYCTMEFVCPNPTRSPKIALLFAR